MARSCKIGIIGAGVSGLSTAYYLRRARQDLGLELDISLLEQSDRLGGVIRTERSGDLLLEAGPEGWASYKRAASNLIKDLGLSSELLGSNDQHRRTFIARSGGLEAIPDGMTFLSPVEPLAFWRTANISRLGKLRAFLEPFVPRTEGDLSARDFFTRRLGAEFADQLIEPFVAAIFGAEFSKLSVPSAMPELYRAEQRAGSLWKGLRPLAKISLSASVLFSLRGGMSRLTQRLEEELSDITIVRGASNLILKKSHSSLVIKGQDFEDEFDHIVFSTPAHAAAQIAGATCPALESLLTDIPYTSSTLVYLSYKKDEFSNPLDGFGFIVPDQEAHVMDACTWVNRKFDGRCPPDTVLLRSAIHNGRRERPDLSDDDLAHNVHAEIRRFLGINSTPVFHRVFHVRSAIPQLLVGHVARISRIRSTLAGCPGIHLAASYYGGVGVPDCIQTAKDTAHAIVAQVGGQA
jgi:oxygen-dependent protoporphyrinogen oxidase